MEYNEENIDLEEEEGHEDAESDEEEPAIGNQLYTLIRSVAAPGKFSVEGSIEDAIMPGLEIKGIGDVSLPLTKSQAKKIIKVSSQAPFGRKEETVYDKTVRNTWQLEPDQFQINNKKWPEMLSEIMENVSQGLGLRSKASCNLYKLLLYETGGFFKSHRDTEKEDGMFGTLVVQLPSIYTGGTLLVRHKGVQHSHDMSNAKKHCIPYTAFFADCEHEIQPVSSGYRLCLVYNMVYQGEGAIPAPFDLDDTVTQLVQLLKRWVENEEPPMFAIMLDHQYTRAGLRFDGLKNADLRTVELLQKVQQQAEFDLHLALVTCHQSGNPENSDDNSDFSDSSDGHDNQREIAMTVTSTKIIVYNWVSENGPTGYKNVALMISENQCFPLEAFSGTPDGQEIEHTGNAGAKMDRWYERAALIIWPPNEKWYFLAHIGHAIEPLVNMVKECIASKELETSSAWQDCLKLAKLVISPERSTLQIKDAPQIVFLCNALGWDNVDLSAYLKSLETPIQIAWLIQLIGIEQRTPLPPSTHRTACIKYGQLLLSKPGLVVPDTIVDLFKIYYLLDEPGHLDTVVTKILSIVKKGDCADEIKTIFEWLGNDAVNLRQLVRLVKEAHQTLTRIADHNPPVQDWSRPTNTIRCDCAACQQLKEYLASSKKSPWSYEGSTRKLNHIRDQVGPIDNVSSAIRTYRGVQKVKVTKYDRNFETKYERYTMMASEYKTMESLLSTLQGF